MKPSGYLFEIAVWMIALGLLAVLNPAEHTHVSLCPLSNLGLSWCPGCGLGRSIASILQGNIMQSFHYHWFGIPALFILISRITSLGKKIKVYYNPKSIL